MTLEEVGELVSSATFRTRSETDTAMVEPDAVVPVVPPGPGQQIVLFTDVEGSTRLADLLGDARAQELRRNHDTLTRQALSKYGGAEIKHTGDGFMASFHSVVDALE